MKRTLLIAGLMGWTVAASAAEPTHPADPAQQALAQMVGEAQSREANALVQVFTLKGQIADLKKSLADAKARAKAAEAKLAPAPAPDADK